MHILFCSAGRRVELLKNARQSLGGKGRIVATDLSNSAPALYVADAAYLVPPITSADYLDAILQICRKERIEAIVTCIDPEIQLLARHRREFEEIGVQVLAPEEESADICFDKYRMYCHLSACGIPTVRTFSDLAAFERAHEAGEIAFPVFVKPRTGSGSVGAAKVESMQQLRSAVDRDPSLIIQEYMGDAVDVDADVYVDTITRQPVSIFAKRKLATRIGGASKTISFKDPKLVDFLCNALQHFSFCGPVDVDLFCRDGQYYLSEINPRFGGAYLHAWGAGVDFFAMLQKNLAGIANEADFFGYEADVAMLMYDSVVITKLEDFQNP